MTPRRPALATRRQVTTREVSACHPPRLVPTRDAISELYHRRSRGWAPNHSFNQHLPVVLGAAGGWPRGRIGSNVNNFSTASVVKLLAGFLLDGGGIGFERSDLVDVLAVFLLQAFDLTLERLQFGVLLAIDHHAVGSEHGVQQQPCDKKDRGRGSQTMPLQGEPRPGRARAFDPARRHGLCPWSLILGLTHGLTDDRAEAFLRTWKDAHSRRWS